MALDFLTGFEHRILATAGNGLFTGLIGSQTGMSIDTSVFKFGSAAFKMDIASAGGQLYRQLSSNSNQVVIGFTWRPNATRTTAFQQPIVRLLDGAASTGLRVDANLINPANGNNAIHLITQSAGADVSDDTHSIVPDNSKWYDIEIKIDASANPWQVAWRVKETDLTSWTEQSFTSAIAATNFQYMYIGTNSIASGWSWYMDQIALARAQTTYLDAFKILGYSPNGVGTHSVDAATSAFFFKDIGGTETALGNSGDTTSHQQIDDVPLDADTDHVLVRAGGASPTYADPNANGTNTAWTGDFNGINDGVRDPTDASTSGDGASISSGTASALEDTGFSNPTYVAGATYTLKIFSGSGAKRGLSVSVNGGGSFTTVHGASETPQWHNVDVTSQITNQTTLDAFTARWRVDSTAGGGGAGTVTIYAAYLEIAPAVTQPTNTWYLEYTLADSGESVAPTAVQALIALAQDSAAACSITAKLREGSNEENIYSGDINSASQIYKSKVFTQRPNSGGAWTDSAFDALVLRWGYTNDADGTPRLAAFIVEALYPISAGASTPQAISAGLTLGVSMLLQVVKMKALSVGLTMSAAITRTKVAPRTISAGLTMTPTMAKPALHPRSLSTGLTLTPTMTRAKSYGKSISAGLTLTPTLAIAKAYARAISASVTLGPTISRLKSAPRLLPIVLSTNPTLVRQLIAYRALAPTFTLTPTLARVKSAPRSLPVTLTLTPTMAIGRFYARGLSVGLTLTPTISQRKGYSRLLPVTLTLTPTMTRLKVAPRALAVTLTLTPTVSRLKIHPQPLSVTLTLAPTMLHPALHPRAISASLVMSPTLSKAKGATRDLLLTMTLTPSLAKQVFQGEVLAVNLTLAPTITRKSTRYRTLSVSPTLISSISRQTEHFVALSTGLVLSPSMVRGHQRTLSVSLPLSVALSEAQRYFKSLSADLILTPAMQKVSSNAVLLDVDLLLDPTLQADFTRNRLLAVDLVMEPFLFVAPSAGFVVFAEGMLLAVTNVGSVSAEEVVEIPKLLGAKVEADLLEADQDIPPILIS